MARDRKKKKSDELEDKKQLESLRQMIDKVYFGTEWQDRIKNMNRWYKQYTGEWWEKEGQEALPIHESRVFMNMIFATIQTNAPLLTDNRPTWYVRAREPHFQHYMNVYNKALEYLWDKNDLENKVFRAVVDSQLYYFGVMKVSFDPDVDDVRHDVVDPKEIVWSPGYDNPQDVAWIGEVSKRPMSWVRRVFPKEYEDVKPDLDYEKEAVEPTHKYSEFQDIEDFVTVYEIWMRDESIEEYIEEVENAETGETEKEKRQRKKYPNGRIITFTHDKILADRASPYKHGSHPYVFFYDYVDPHSIWGMGEPVQIENLNKELNLRLQDLAHYARHHARPNYFVDASSGLDPDKIKEEMIQGDNIWAINFGVNNEPIKMQDIPNVNPIHELMVNLLMRGHEEISGVTDVSKGMATKKERQSASEVSILIESSYTRTRQRVRNLESAIKDMARLSVEIMQQYYKTSRTFSFRKDDEVTYGKISNSPEALMETAPKPVAPGSAPGAPNVPINAKPEQLDKYKREREDYEAILEYLAGGDVDEVYAEFDIEIQTNSTLPMDRQSLANLAMRLFEIKAIDREAMLDILNFPRAEEIEQRMKANEKQMAMMKMGGGGIPGMPKPGGKPQTGPARPLRISQ